MPLLDWEKKYSVDVEEMDEQHIKIIDLINKAHQMMTEGRAHIDLGCVIDQLLHYTEYHFALEEQYMKEAGYEGFDHQHEQHQFFISRIREYKEQYETGRVAASVKLVQLMMDWLINHITVTDRKYTEHFHKAGIK